MRIAICALAWNQANVTERWLQSVKRHSPWGPGSDVRLFLLDNGSTDGGESLRVLRAAATDSPSVALRNEENESIYRGWNRLSTLALEAGADIIILSNNDLLVGPGWLDAVRREVAASGKRYFLPNGNFARPDFFEDDARAFLASFCPTGGPRTLLNARAGWCLILPAAAVREFLPIPEELILWYGDDYIHWKLARAGYSCETILDCTALHYGSISFYARPGYNAIVEQDKATWQAWLAAQEGRP